ncbi:MAG: hypothetical protein AB8B74_14675 [Crocinitomicaceae bacterium]
MEATMTTKKFTSKLLNPDTFYIKYKQDSILNAADFKLSYNSFLEMGQGKPLKALVVIGKNAFIDADVSSCHSNTQSVVSRAKAIVTDSLAIRMLVCQSVIEQNKSQLVKVFKSKISAKKWLNSLA